MVYLQFGNGSGVGRGAEINLGRDLKSLRVGLDRWLDGIRITAANRNDERNATTVRLANHKEVALAQAMQSQREAAEAVSGKRIDTGLKEHELRRAVPNAFERGLKGS